MHTRLSEATNAAREPVPESDTLTFELVKFNPHGLGKAEGSAKYTSTACSTAVKVMHDAFAPLILESGEDMISLVCHSKDADSHGNFSGFRLAVLRQRGTLVCAATVRVFGTTFAELPFVATREGHRKSGFCRALLSALAAKLCGWGVQWLLLPSVPETRQLWTRHFGFTAMSKAEVEAVSERIVMPAEENVSMLKLHIAQHPPPPKATLPAGKSAPPKSAGGAASSSVTRSCAAQPSRVGRGTGTFASLAAAVPAAPAAPTAKRSPECTSGEEALGHTLADVLLSTMYDVDDERRSAQAEKHALLLQVQEQQRVIQELRAQLRAALSQAAAGKPSAAGVADASAGGCDADVDVNAALAVLQALTDAQASPPKSPRSVLPDIVMAMPALPDVVMASPAPEVEESPQPLPTTPAATVTPAPAAKLALPPLPPRCITDEAVRAEAVDFAAQVLRRMPPDSTTWMADGTGAQLVMGEPLSWQGQEAEVPMFDMQLVTEERLEHMTECL